MSADRLNTFAQRLDRLEDDRQALMEDIREVYSEVKGEGYNPRALRKVLAERRKPTPADLQADLDVYRAALGVEGATYRSVAEQFGISKSKLHRLVPRDSNGTDHRDMVEGDLGDPLLVIDKPRAQFREKVRAIAASIKAPEMIGEARTPAWDDLVIPEFLGRTA